jgi:plasmid stabilization system protein ParE
MEIVWRASALNDLKALGELIAEEKPLAATRVAAAICDAVDRLGRHPRRGRAGRVEGTRELIIAKYALHRRVPRAGNPGPHPRRHSHFAAIAAAVLTEPRFSGISLMFAGCRGIIR